MNKQDFFRLVDEKKAVQEVIEKLVREHNEIVFTDNQEAIDFNDKATKHYHSRLDNLNRRLENGRTYFSKEELSEMSKEYRNR